jgi:trigger factor
MDFSAMQVTETANEGLKRAYTVTVPAADIAAQKDKRLAELAKDMKLPGFRPGKVPQKVVQARFGTAVMGEVLEASVQEATGKVVSERGLRPALQPKIELVNFSDGADLEFKVDLEVLPEIPMPDFSAIKLTRLKATPGDVELNAALDNMPRRQGRGASLRLRGPHRRRGVPGWLGHRHADRSRRPRLHPWLHRAAGGHGAG